MLSHCTNVYNCRLRGLDAVQSSGHCPVHSTQSTAGIWSSFNRSSSPRDHISKEWQRVTVLYMCVCVCGKSFLSLYLIFTHMSAIQCVSETTVRCLPAIKLCFYWVMAQNHFELVVYIWCDLEDFKNSERNAFGFLVSKSDKIFILFLKKKKKSDQ